MKLLFSEANSDYSAYQFPYAIWAIPEAGEPVGVFFEAGFLPSSPNLDRFYLCRQIRVTLPRFRLSSENRRIVRKGKGIEWTLLARSDFEFTEERRRFYKQYADIKFGKDVMTWQRLDTLFHSKLTTHVMVFRDEAVAKEIGAVTLLLDGAGLAYYYYAFYDLTYYPRNLGLFMMVSALQALAERGVRHVYLGTCYSRNALYKAQFSGAEFFNGFRWSDRLTELKYLLRREEQGPRQHLLESDDFRERFYPKGLAEIAGQSRFQLELRSE